ncbi:MAG TPA: ATP synthase F1 subunit delta [Flavobacteriales bacterium]|nr:ATP synthase F1 subunit delta [Flavobacteriales bacterium]
MNISPVAYRYARSLMQLAQEHGAVDAVRDDLHLVADTTAASRDLQVMLKSPVIKADSKLKVLGRVFGGHIGRISERFIDILVRKGRESMLQEIAQAYQEVYRQANNILLAEVRSASPLNDQARQQVRAMVEKRHPGKKITLNESVDPALIGGAVIRIGDEQIDASVSRRLSDLRRKFSENPYIPGF